MQLTIVAAVHATLLWITVFGQDDELFSLGNTTFRGSLTVKGAILEYKKIGQSALIEHYKTVICNFIQILKASDPVTHGKQITCLPHQSSSSNSEFELSLSIMVPDDYRTVSVTSPSYTSVTMHRVFYADEVNPFIPKFRIATDQTIIHLTGSILQNGQHFIPHWRLSDWYTDGYSEIESKICREIIDRINQDSVLRTIDVVCGLTVIYTRVGIGMAYLILPNDQLKRAGFELTYKAVGLAVQNAVLRRPLQRENINYHCRLILPYYESQVTYYLLRGQMELNGVTLTYSSEAEAGASGQLREIIDQICDMARAQRTSAERLEGHSLNCALRAYNPATSEVTVFMTAYSSQLEGNAIWSVAAAQFPFTLSNGVINYRASLVHNEILREKPSADDHLTLVYRTKLAGAPNFDIYRYNSLEIALRFVQSYVCYNLFYYETNPEAIQHQCRVVSFNPVSWETSFEFIISHEELSRHGLSPGEVYVRWNGNKLQLTGSS